MPVDHVAHGIQAFRSIATVAGYPGCVDRPESTWMSRSVARAMRTVSATNAR